MTVAKQARGIGRNQVIGSQIGVMRRCIFWLPSSMVCVACSAPWTVEVVNMPVVKSIMDKPAWDGVPFMPRDRPSIFTFSNCCKLQPHEYLSKRTCFYFQVSVPGNWLEV